jgi:hypothetical protein
VGLFDRFRKNRGTPSGPVPSAETLAALREFIASREGVEGYIEPQTAVYGMTLLLVAGDGEHLRRPVKDERQARRLCSEAGIPLYDARIVGYPRRMKDFQRGVRPPRISLEDLPPLNVTGDGNED